MFSKITVSFIEKYINTVVSFTSYSVKAYVFHILAVSYMFIFYNTVGFFRLEGDSYPQKYWCLGHINRLPATYCEF